MQRYKMEAMDKRKGATQKEQQRDNDGGMK